MFERVVLCKRIAGFRCGFLGLLHLEIIQERLSREYDLDLITTAPSVVYRIQLRASKTDAAREIMLHNPADYPDPRSEEHTSELQSLMRISYAVFCLKKK